MNIAVTSLVFTTGVAAEFKLVFLALLEFCYVNVKQIGYNLNKKKSLMTYALMFWSSYLKSPSYQV